MLILFTARGRVCEGNPSENEEARLDFFISEGLLEIAVGRRTRLRRHEHEEDSCITEVNYVNRCSMF